MTDNIESLLSLHDIKYDCNVSLKSKTWIKTGGTTAYWITPTSIEQLKVLVKYLYENNQKFEIVGYTSNLFFKNAYNPEIVISTIKLNKYTIEDCKIVCECGVNISKLSRECVKIGYAGFYGMVDLPGTVAAAVYNNATCFDCGVADHLESIEFLTPQGDLITLSKKQLEYTYRTSILKEKRMEGIILSAKLNVQLSDDIDLEIRKSEDTHTKRTKTQEGPKLNLGTVYSHLTFRKNVRNFIVRVLNKLFKLKPKQMKKLFLHLYGYQYLSNYISDKALITFVWRDENSEAMFQKYNQFMNEVYKNTALEIEIKDGKQ